jgi:hypothetical protein
MLYQPLTKVRPTAGKETVSWQGGVAAPPGIRARWAERPREPQNQSPVKPEMAVSKMIDDSDLRCP